MRAFACVTGVVDSGQPEVVDAVAAVYGQSFRRLVGVVALAADSRSDAEECVQEAFVRLLGKWSTVSTYDDPEAWVRHVAFRLLSNRRRNARAALRGLVRHGPPADGRAPDGDRLDVAAALADLPLSQRQVVVLHHLLGYSIVEVSDVLRVPAGTVKSRLARGHAALAPLLTEESRHA